MSNIESDINQNVDKIVQKIDLEDFLQILAKYALKLDNFSVIKDLLNNEKARVGKFVGVTDKTVGVVQEGLEKMFDMSWTKI